MNCRETKEFKREKIQKEKQNFNLTDWFIAVTLSKGVAHAGNKVVWAGTFLAADFEDGRTWESAGDQQVIEQRAASLFRRHDVQNSPAGRIDCGQSGPVVDDQTALAGHQRERQISHHFAVGFQMLPRPGSGSNHRNCAVLDVHRGRQIGQIVDSIAMDRWHQIRNATQIHQRWIAT